MTWIWGYEDCTGRWFHHVGWGCIWMAREKETAYRYPTKDAAQRSMRGHRREWGAVGRRHFLIRLRPVRSRSEER